MVYDERNDTPTPERPEDGLDSIAPWEWFLLGAMAFLIWIVMKAATR